MLVVISLLASQIDVGRINEFLSSCETWLTVPITFLLSFFLFFILYVFIFWREMLLLSCYDSLCSLCICVCLQVCLTDSLSLSLSLSSYFSFSLFFSYYYISI